MPTEVVHFRIRLVKTAIKSVFKATQLWNM